MIVCDSGPLRYLILLGYETLLPDMFGTVIVPAVVASELTRPASPEVVRRFFFSPPIWMTFAGEAAISAEKHAGEWAAIELAQRNKAVLLIDDSDARLAAVQRRLRILGTVGLFFAAETAGRVDVVVALDRLRQTNFHFGPRLEEEVRKRLSGRPGKA